MLAGGVDTGLQRSARDAQVVGDLGVVQLISTNNVGERGVLPLMADTSS